jgi:hypothetical protein
MDSGVLAFREATFKDGRTADGHHHGRSMFAALRFAKAAVVGRSV